MEEEKQMITKEMGIMEVVEKYPMSGQVFAKYGMGCVGCMAAKFENIEQGAKAHGFGDEKVDEMIEALNKMTSEE